MAKKSKSRSDAANGAKRGKAAKVGFLAALAAGMVWLTGGASWDNVWDWTKSLTLAISLALLFRWPIGEPYRIPSGSMEPTLHGDPGFLRGDRVWVNKYVYGVRFPLNRAHIPFTDITIRYADRRIWRGQDPKRWDVVVFKSAEENPQHNTLIKRIVGLPGERIHIANGKVYANGRELQLPSDMPDLYYTEPEGFYSGMTYGILEDDAHALVPPDHYLVLGDNSGHSRDGRFWGWLPNENIVGRAASIWWPPSRWRDFTGFSKTWWWRSLLTFLAVLTAARLFLGRSWRTCPRPEDASQKPLHLYVDRLVFGLPIPFTRKRFYHGRSPRRGEPILYRARDKDRGEELLLVGRVAGLPGERVFLEDGKLLVNDAPVDGPACIAEGSFPPSDGMGLYARSKTKQYATVPEGHYFILRDDAWSEGALDGRTTGWTARNDLVGVCRAVWWPPSRWGGIAT